MNTESVSFRMSRVYKGEALMVIKNIRALIKEYMKDPDTPKFDIKSLLALSLTTVPITI